jgi:hypothetical protein
MSAPSPLINETANQLIKQCRLNCLEVSCNDACSTNPIVLANTVCQTGGGETQGYSGSITQCEGVVMNPPVNITSSMTSAQVAGALCKSSCYGDKTCEKACTE